MSWYNPASWFEAKATTLTLDQAVARLDLIQQTAADIRVTPKTSIRAPTVYAIVNAMSRAVASLPFLIVKDESENKKRQIETLPDHNIRRLLGVRPNNWQTPYEYWSLVLVRLLLYGSFYARKLQAANGRIVEIQPLDPETVRVEQLETGKLLFHVQGFRGKEEALEQNKMHWINGLSMDGVHGTSPVDKCKESIALEIAIELFGARIFGSGAIPNVIVKRKGHFKDEDAMQRFRDSFTNAFKKKRGTAILEDDFDFEVVQMTPEDSQFLETRKHQRTVIAGAFGVPPHIVGDLERATFSNIEHMSLSFVIHALRPWLECIEAAVSRDLLTQAEVLGNVKPMFDTRAMLRGDAKSRAEALKIQREWGIINANEWRALEGMDAREDEAGEEYLTPMNFEASEDESTAPADELDEVDVSNVRNLR